jgi:transposase
MAKDFRCIAYRQSNLNTMLTAIENINRDIISKELARYGHNSEDAKTLLSMTGIDMETCELAGIAPSIRESSGKTKTSRITKQGSPLLRWILVRCATTAVRYDKRLGTFYERLKKNAKAIVASAKEILVII